MGNIWAVILAAGESKRMGFPKMLLPFHGTTMLENVIRHVKNSEVDNIIIVLGAEKDRLTEMAVRNSVMHCYNDSYKDGMLSSVICGCRNVSGEADAVMIFQGDQPLIKPKSINAVINTYRRSEKSIVIPVYNKRRGHPLL